MTEIHFQFIIFNEIIQTKQEESTMVFDKIKSLIVEQFMVSDPDTITMQTSFVDDLEADSLDIVELIMAVEEEFGVAIDDQDVDGVKTIGDVVNYIIEKQGN